MLEEYYIVFQMNFRSVFLNKIQCLAAQNLIALRSTLTTDDVPDGTVDTLELALCYCVKFCAVLKVKKTAY